MVLQQEDPFASLEVGVSRGHRESQQTGSLPQHLQAQWDGLEMVPTVILLPAIRHSAS